MVLVQNTGRNKKGLSPVVATVALILITVAAAMLIMGFVVPFVKNKLTEGTECIGYEEYFTFYEGFDYNCYIKIGDNYLYAFSLESDTVSSEKFENIGGARIQFLGNGEGRGVEINNGGVAGNSEGQIRMLNKTVLQLALPERGGVKTYVYNSSLKYDIIEAYPILKNGRMCGKTDEIRIADCEPMIDLEG